MIILCNIKESGILIEKQILTSIDDTVEAQIRNKFTALISKGVLYDCNYDDDSWNLTDQCREYHIAFNVHRDDLMALCSKRGYDYSEIIRVIKAVTLINLGSIDLSNLRIQIHYVQNALYQDRLYAQTNPDDIVIGNITAHTLYRDILDLLDAPEEYLEACDIAISNFLMRKALCSSGKKPSVLTDFPSYFKFSEILELFWAEASAEEKEYYWPLYAYWRVTTIIPQRVTEFCLTPLDCISQEGAHYYIQLRRSNLKSAYTFHEYDIDKDFQIFRHRIDERTYNLFAYYKDITRDYSHPYDLLISKEHYILHKSGTTKKLSKNSVFDRRDLNKLFARFYEDIIIKRYGYTLLSEEEINAKRTTDSDYRLEDNEIMMMQLRHTRHLAMMNLVAWGCNPMIIKDFAGQSDESSAFNYYGNISKFVKSSVYAMYSHSKSCHVDELTESGNPLSRLIDTNEPSVEIENGRCYSSSMLNGSCADCAKCDGVCMKCRYFIPHESTIDTQLQDQIDSEFKFLQTMLRSDDISAKIAEYKSRTLMLEHNILLFAQNCAKELRNEKETHISTIG